MWLSNEPMKHVHICLNYIVIDTHRCTLERQTFGSCAPACMSGESCCCIKSKYAAFLRKRENEKIRKKVRKKSNCAKR